MSNSYSNWSLFTSVYDVDLLIGGYLSAKDRARLSQVSRNGRYLVDKANRQNKAYFFSRVESLLRRALYDNSIPYRVGFHQLRKGLKNWTVIRQISDQAFHQRCQMIQVLLNQLPTRHSLYLKRHELIEASLLPYPDILPEIDEIQRAFLQFRRDNDLKAFLTFVRDECKDPELELELGQHQIAIYGFIMSLKNLCEHDPTALELFFQTVASLIDKGVDVNLNRVEIEGMAFSLTNLILSHTLFSTFPGEFANFTQYGLALFEKCLINNGDVNQLNWVFSPLDYQKSVVTGHFFPITNFNSLSFDVFVRRKSVVLELIKLILQHSNDEAIKKQIVNLYDKRGVSIFEIARDYHQELSGLLSSVERADRNLQEWWNAYEKNEITFQTFLKYVCTEWPDANFVVNNQSLYCLLMNFADQPGVLEVLHGLIERATDVNKTIGDGSNRTIEGTIVQDLSIATATIDFALRYSYEDFGERGFPEMERVMNLLQLALGKGAHLNQKITYFYNQPPISLIDKALILFEESQNQQCMRLVFKLIRVYHPELFGGIFALQDDVFICE